MIRRLSNSILVLLTALACVHLGALPCAFAADESEEAEQAEQTKQADQTRRTERAESAAQEDREQILRLDSVLRPYSPWTQIELGGSFYDSHRDVISPRLNLGLSGGYRFENFGLLTSFELDHNWDFTQETDTLTLFNAGVGAEFLYVLGHARSSATAGVTVLLESTALDDAGTVGWFVDLRPVSIRWGIGSKAAVELTPIGLDLSVPVTKGIPLVLVSFMTRLGMEWSWR